MIKVNFGTLGVLILVLVAACSGDPAKIASENTSYSKVDSLLLLMTLEEKIGQMNLVTGKFEDNNPTELVSDYQEQVKSGRIGNFLNVTGVEATMALQKIAVEESRLGIPLLFGYDVIHGYKTISPIPLAEAASWDLEAIEASARMAAVEASASGINWAFAPMVDVSRDPRWGRIMETSGEDPWYASQVAVARVKGFQGDDLASPHTLLACAKHYAGYGNPIAGRDYTITDFSERELWEVHMPPFKSAIEAGVGSIMTSYTEVNGVPVTANEFLLRTVLRDRWQFDGFVVTDWGTIRDLLRHGVAKDSVDAARMSVLAGSEMDMVEQFYIDYLPGLVRSGVVKESFIDEAVSHILVKKFELGLFDHPYAYHDVNRERNEILTRENREKARDMARKSMVLLENKNNTLPLSRDISSVALIGPLADNPADLMGRWNGKGEPGDVITVLQGIKNVAPDVTINYTKGVDFDSEDRSGFKAAIEAARRSEVIIMALGEYADISGEAASRAFITVPGLQVELAKELRKLGKPLIVVLFNGRPLAIPWLKDNADALLEAWLPGTEGGNAVADILFGAYNPSGKLPVTFPLTGGQIPIYYSYKNTGKPYGEETHRYTSRYMDIPNEPLYPFGYGLSYSTFVYSNLQVSVGEKVGIKVTVKNTGDRAGEEVVQLYTRDVVRSVTPPLKELKGFKKITLGPWESKEVTFVLSKEDLKFYDQRMDFVFKPGQFRAMVGTNAMDHMQETFKLDGLE